MAVLAVVAKALDPADDGFDLAILLLVPARRRGRRRRLVAAGALAPAWPDRSSAGLLGPARRPRRDGDAGPIDLDDARRSRRPRRSSWLALAYAAITPGYPIAVRDRRSARLDRRLHRRMQVAVAAPRRTWSATSSSSGRRGRAWPPDRDVRRGPRRHRGRSAGHPAGRPQSRARGRPRGARPHRAPVRRIAVGRRASSRPSSRTCRASSRSRSCRCTSRPSRDDCRWSAWPGTTARSTIIDIGVGIIGRAAIHADDPVRARMSSPIPTIGRRATTSAARSRHRSCTTTSCSASSTSRGRSRIRSRPPTSPWPRCWPGRSRRRSAPRDWTRSVANGCTRSSASSRCRGASSATSTGRGPFAAVVDAARDLLAAESVARRRA